MRSLILLALAGGIALANDTAVWEYPDGSSVIPMAEDRVQMVAETVNVKAGPGLEAEVEARFTLRNLTDKDLRITVGFPADNQWGGPDYDANGLDSTALLDSMGFKCLVDGRSQPVRFRADQEREEWGSARYFYIWDVDFAPGETKHLVTRYRTLWTRWIDIEGRMAYEFRYITTTGHAWAGSIEDAVFRVEVPKGVPPVGISDSMALSRWEMPKFGLVQTDERVVAWHMRNWKPDRDIQIEYLGQVYINSVNGFTLVGAVVDSDVTPGSLQTKQALENFLADYSLPEDVAAQLYINSLFALAGHDFKNPSLREMFLSLGVKNSGKTVKLSDLPRDWRKSISIAQDIKRDYQQRKQKVLSGPYGNYFTDMSVLFVYPPVWLFQNGGFVDYIRDDDPGTWLKLAINAFYARSGKRFKDAQLQAFFELMPWYHPQDGGLELYDEEQAVVDAMVKYAREHGYR